MPKFLIPFFLLTALPVWFYSPVLAAQPQASAPSPQALDKEAVKAFYFEGEFDKVINILEPWRKANPNASLADMVFIYKYLSVVHAANPATRKRAESYMYQLLKLKPTIELLDMYISDSIEGIFKDVRADFSAREAYLKKQRGNPDSVNSGVSRYSQPGASAAAAGTVPSQPAAANKTSKKWVWLTLGGTAVAGVVAAFLLLSPDEAPAPGAPGSLTNSKN